MKITPDSVSVVKKTLTLGAPTGIVATPDSTAFFKSFSAKYGDEFGRLFDAKVKELRKLGATEENAFSAAYEDPQVRLALKRAQTGAQAIERQANKGKEGFDKDGYPLPKVSAPAMKAIAKKLTGK